MEEEVKVLRLELERGQKTRIDSERILRSDLQALLHERERLR
jgi:hypothetical protein